MVERQSRIVGAQEVDELTLGIFQFKVSFPTYYQSPQLSLLNRASNSIHPIALNPAIEA